MFVQVIQGQVSDAKAVKAALDRWQAELAPEASGWLGSTAGVSADGKFVALARFDSEDAARRNSDKPEQDKWWAETATLFTGQPTFRDTTDVVVEEYGDLDSARFVQVMTGRSSNPERARELMADDSVDWQSFRPDIIGSVGLGYEGGDWLMAIYFTSEAEAREGERKEPPPDIAKAMAEMDAVSEGEPTYIDITEPWLYSPK
jgi:hypothetical protein